MIVRSQLLEDWRSALVFRIDELGDDDDALPDPAAFPAHYLANDQDVAAECLGYVMGAAWLKRYRPWPIRPGDSFELDVGGCMLSSVAESAFPHDLTRAGMLGTLDYLVQLALCAPDRLPELNRRLDTLDDATLHAWGLAAVINARDTPLFDGLLDDVRPVAQSGSTLASVMPGVAALVVPAALETLLPATAAAVKLAGSL